MNTTLVTITAAILYMWVCGKILQKKNNSKLCLSSDLIKAKINLCFMLFHLKKNFEIMWQKAFNPLVYLSKALF